MGKLKMFQPALLLTGLASYHPVYQLLAAALCRGAFFSATDYLTSPLTR